MPESRGTLRSVSEPPRAEFCTNCFGAFPFEPVQWMWFDPLQTPNASLKAISHNSLAYTSCKCHVRHASFQVCSTSHPYTRWHGVGRDSGCTLRLRLQKSEGAHTSLVCTSHMCRLLPVEQLNLASLNCS